MYQVAETHHRNKHQIIVNEQATSLSLAHAHSQAGDDDSEASDCPGHAHNARSLAEVIWVPRGREHHGRTGHGG